MDTCLLSALRLGRFVRIAFSDSAGFVGADFTSGGQQQAPPVAGFSAIALNPMLQPVAQRPPNGLKEDAVKRHREGFGGGLYHPTDRVIGDQSPQDSLRAMAS